MTNDFFHQYAGGWIYRLVNILLDEHLADFDWNSLDSTGVAPLHLATYFRLDYLVTRLLKDAHVDHNLFTRKTLPLPSSQTALHLAATQDNYNITRLLLQHGADPLRLDHHGRTPCQIAAVQSFDDLVSLYSAREQDGATACLPLSPSGPQFAPAEPAGVPVPVIDWLQFGSVQDAVVGVASQAVSGWRRPVQERAPLGGACPIPRVDARNLTLEVFERDFLSTGRPVFITNVIKNWPVKELWRRTELAEDHSLKEFMVGNIPYGFIFGENHGMAPLFKYLQSIDQAVKEPAEEPMYIFDSKILHNKKFFNLAEEAPFPAVIFQGLRPKHWYPQFFLGPINSGAPFQVHCPAVNGVVFGDKRWLLYPPAKAFFSKKHTHPWYNEAEKIIQEAAKTGSPVVFPETDAGIPLECTQREGDLIYLPPFWGHAILNLAESIGLAIEFDIGDC